MKSIASKLDSIINAHMAALKAIPEARMSFKPSPEKWSRKEMMGHLVDSAQNNIRRFLVAQYEVDPKIVYSQDKWVALTGYQDYDTPDLISLWCLLNRHIVKILKRIPAEMGRRNCQTEELHSLEWLAEDYYKHLLHHLHVVLGLEPVAYP